MATAVSGAVILRDERSTVMYQRVCDKCGGKSTTTTTSGMAKGFTHTESFRCGKCGNQQKVVIKG